MGIPAYFINLVKKYNCIVKKYDTNILDLHNLYLDSNSIIYDAIKKLDYNSFKNKNSYEYEIINWVCLRIDYYINYFKPKEKIFIAFDGPAPLAKLEQQRSRRYKTFINKKLNEELLDKPNNEWNSLKITPGTEFMNKLNNKIKNYYLLNKNILVSTSDEEGEGEHKIFNLIRDNPDFHKFTNTFIYGLDADLIMLTISNLNISPNLFLIRESPDFKTGLEKLFNSDQILILDVYELKEKIKEEYFINIEDYLFLCFLLGNDFLPHFPALNIRLNGIDIILETFKIVLGKFNKSIINVKNNKEIINWNSFKILIKELAKIEEEVCIKNNNERDKLEKRKQDINDKEERLLNLPIIDRRIENIISIGKDGWEYRYYWYLFNIEIDDERRKQISFNYLEGLEWVFEYYKGNCKDWRWKYNYNYPPLLKDLQKYIPDFSPHEFLINKKPEYIDAITQLAYVIPRNSLEEVISKNLFKDLIKNCNDFYSLDNKIIWCYCRYFWESHIEFPDIDLKILERIVNKNKNK
tara:strand:- start:44 stop:1612 length:1569 start_codon:yes stop_codon:yes gene_type:complete